MNPTALRAILVGVAIVPLVAWSARKLRRSPTAASALQAIGALGLLMVVVAHICEAFHLLPRLGWGQPRSVGHYLDLSGAALGLALVPLGYFLSRRRRARPSH